MQTGDTPPPPSQSRKNSSSKEKGGCTPFSGRDWPSECKRGRRPEARGMYLESRWGIPRKRPGRPLMVPSARRFCEDHFLKRGATTANTRSKGMKLSGTAVAAKSSCATMAEMTAFFCTTVACTGIPVSDICCNPGPLIMFR